MKEPENRLDSRSGPSLAPCLDPRPGSLLDSRPGTRGRISQKRAAHPPNGEAREPGPRLSGGPRPSEPPRCRPSSCGRASPPAWAPGCTRSQRAQCPQVGRPDPRLRPQGEAPRAQHLRAPAPPARRARPQAAGGQGVKMARDASGGKACARIKSRTLVFFSSFLFLKSHF